MNQIYRGLQKHLETKLQTHTHLIYRMEIILPNTHDIYLTIITIVRPFLTLQIQHFSNTRRNFPKVELNYTEFN